MANQNYHELLPHERMLLVGKVVDMMIYHPDFCGEMMQRVALAEEVGAIKSKFHIETQVELSQGLF